jgi:universal stress protein A
MLAETPAQENRMTHRPTARKSSSHDTKTRESSEDVLTRSVPMIDGFKRIMLPIDFSEHCDRAAEYAAWVAGMCKATVHLVHVISNPADAIYEPHEQPHWVMVAHAQERAMALLGQVAGRYLPPDYPRELHVVVGDPYEKLVDLARSLTPDLIVMSTHGRSGVAHLVMGSVAEKIVRYAPCPVLVVRRTTAE